MNPRPGYGQTTNGRRPSLDRGQLPRLAVYSSDGRSVQLATLYNYESPSPGGLTPGRIFPNRITTLHLETKGTRIHQYTLSDIQCPADWSNATAVFASMPNIFDARGNSTGKPPHITGSASVLCPELWYWAVLPSNVAPPRGSPPTASIDAAKALTLFSERRIPPAALLWVEENGQAEGMQYVDQPEEALGGSWQVVPETQGAILPFERDVEIACPDPNMASGTSLVRILALAEGDLYPQDHAKLSLQWKPEIDTDRAHSPSSIPISLIPRQ